MADTGDFVPINPDDNPFIDNEALRELVEKVVDALRPIGLTVQPDGIGFMMHPEHGMNMMIQALVRPSAQEKITEDKKSREDFNKLMADQNEAMVEDKAAEVRAAIGGDLEELLFGDSDTEVEDDGACKHENMHPSGFCMDCGYGMKNTDNDGIEESDEDEGDGTQPTA